MPLEPNTGNLFDGKDTLKKLGAKGKWPTVEEIGSMVKEGSMTDTARTPIQFLDPAYFDPILFFIQHRDRKELNFRLRYEYEFHPLVHNALDLHSQFPLSDFTLQCGDSKIQQFYNDLKDEIELLPLMMDILKDYWLLGESIVHGHWDETAKTWKNFVMYPPERVEVKGTHISSEKIFLLEVDNALQKLATSQEPYDKELAKGIDPKILEQIRGSGKIWLKPDQTFHFFRKTSRYDLRGTSIVKSIYKDLLYEHKLRLLQFTFVDRHMFPMKIFKLGNPQTGWIPPQSHFETFRNLLMSAANDPDFSIIFHHGLQVDYVGTKDKIANLIPEFDFVENRILTGLFTNKAITHGEGVTYANANVSVRVLMHRYLVIRDMLELVLKNKVFRRVAEERGYYRSPSNDDDPKEWARIHGKYKVLDLPRIKWRKLNLLDDTAQKQFLIKMREMKDLPHKVLAENMDMDADELVKQLKREEGTVVDPEYQNARDSLSGDKKIARQILKGKKGHEWDVVSRMKDDTEDEGKAQEKSKLSPSIRPAPAEPVVAPRSPEPPAGKI